MITVRNGMETMPAISLADLQREAAFLTRQDRKYLLPLLGLEGLLTGLEGNTRVLEIDGQRCFRYKTPYFDDHDLTAYFRALRRRPQRFKVRTRLYLESGLRQLEVKLRDGRGRTVKHRIAPETTRLEHLEDGDRAWLRSFSPVAPYAAHLRHCLTTCYRRSTLVLPNGEGRVTIDHDLVFALPNGQALALPAIAIVETKGAGKATAVDHLLWRHGYRPLSLSKFTVGLGLLRPDLPANRLHRLRARLQAVAEMPHHLTSSAYEER